MTLEQYVEVLRKIERINERLLKMELKQCAGRSTIMSDMPKGGIVDFDKMANYMIRREALEDQRRRLQLLIADEPLNETEMQLIRFRYVLGYKWREVANAISFKLRHTFRLHEKIIKKFEKN